MKKHLFHIIPVFLASAIAVTAVEDLLVFEIGNLESDPAGSFAPITAQNVTGFDLTRGGRAEHNDAFSDPALNVDGLFGAGSWSRTSERDPSTYFEFGVAPAAGFSLELDTLTFALFEEHFVNEVENEVRTFIGPLIWDIAYSLDGFATDGTLLATVQTPEMTEELEVGQGRYNQQVFQLSLAGIDVPEGETLSFRFYGYDRPDEGWVTSYGGFSNKSDGDPGPFSSAEEVHDSIWVGDGSDIILTGTAIPEPSHVAVAIAGLALFVTVLVRRRRKQ